MIDETLAARVTHALQLAGLPRVSRESNPAGGFGIQLAEEVLYVVWNPAPELSETVFQKMTSNDIEHPAVLQSGLIEQTMSQAILTILLSAGINARMSVNDLTPATVEVSP